MAKNIVVLGSTGVGKGTFLQAINTSVKGCSIDKSNLPPIIVHNTGTDSYRYIESLDIIKDANVKNLINQGQLNGAIIVLGEKEDLEKTMAQPLLFLQTAPIKNIFVFVNRGASGIPNITSSSRSIPDILTTFQCNPTRSQFIGSALLAMKGDPVQQRTIQQLIANIEAVSK